VREKSRWSILCRPGEAHFLEKQGLADATFRIPITSGAEAKADFAERMVTIMLSSEIFLSLLMLYSNALMSKTASAVVCTVPRPVQR